MQQFLNKKPIDFAHYILERTQNFMGREWTFKLIDDWLAKEKETGILVIIGEPGSGKTALAGRLSQFSSGNILQPEYLRQIKRGFLNAVHFCSVLDIGWINPRKFSESLALQLAEEFEEYARALVELSGDRQVKMNIEQNVQNTKSVTGLVIQNLIISGITSEEVFIRLIRDPLDLLYSKDPKKKIIILIDALEESMFSKDNTNIAELISRMANIPPNLKLILTTRPQAGLLLNLRRLRPKATEIHLNYGEGLTNSGEDIKKYVLHTFETFPNLKNKLEASLAPDNFATIVQEKSEGNFLFVYYLIKMLISKNQIISKASLNELPSNLDEIYVEFIQRLIENDKKNWDTKYKPVLSVLAVAQESLTEYHLSEFTKIDEDIIRGILSSLRQLLDVEESVPSSQRKYAMYHRSFSDFLLDKDKAEDFWCGNPSMLHYKVAEYYLNSWRGDNRQLSNLKFKLHSDVINDYAFNHLCFHLRQSKRIEELFDIVVNDTWYDIQAYMDPTFSRYLNDIEQTWLAVHEENKNAITKNLPASQLDKEVYCSLVNVAINNFSNIYPIDLLKIALIEGFWKEEHALSIAIRNPDPKSKIHLLEGLIPHLHGSALKDAIDVLVSIDESSEREYSLINIIKNIPTSYHEKIIQTIINSTRNMNDQHTKADLLTRILPYISESQRQDILNDIMGTIRTINTVYLRSEHLSRVLPYISKSQRQDILREIFGTLVESNTLFTMVEGLLPIIPFLNEITPVSPIIKDFLDSVSEMKLDLARISVIADLLPYVEDTDYNHILQNTINIGKQIENPYDRLESLTVLYPLIKDETKSNKLNELMELIGELNDNYRKNKLFRKIIRYLDHNQIEKAIGIVTSFEDNKEKVDTLALLMDSTHQDNLIIKILNPLLDSASKSNNLLIMLDAFLKGLPYLKGIVDYKQEDMFEKLLRSCRRIYLDKFVDLSLNILSETQIDKRRAFLEEVLKNWERLVDPIVMSKALVQLTSILPRDDTINKMNKIMEGIGYNLVRSIYYTQQYMDYVDLSLKGYDSLLGFHSRSVQIERALNAIAILIPITSEEMKSILIPLLLFSTEKINVDGNRADALISIIPILPEEIMPEILISGQELKSVSERVKVLIEIIPKLSRENLLLMPLIAERIYKNSMEVSKGYPINDNNAALELLVSTFPYLDSNERSVIKEKIFSIVHSTLRVIEKPSKSFTDFPEAMSRFREGGSLQYVGERKSFEILQANTKEYTLYILTRLLPHLSGIEIDDVLSIIHENQEKIDSIVGQVAIHSNIIRYLPETNTLKLSDEILTLSNNIEKTHIQTKCISNILQIISPSMLYTSWHNIIRKGITADSENLFTTISLWIPYLHRIGADNFEIATVDRVTNIIHRWNR